MVRFEAVLVGLGVKRPLAERRLAGDTRRCSISTPPPGGIALRPKIQPQCDFEFPVSKLALTQQYYAKYQAISKILDQVPEILALAHGDLKHALEEVTGCEKDGSRFRSPRAQ